MFKEITKRKIIKYLETNKIENTTYQNMGCSKSSPKSEVYSAQCLHLKKKNSKNNLAAHH